VPIDDLTIALRTDEQTLFCTWKMDDPTSTWYSAGGNSSHGGRDRPDDVHQGSGDPPEIVVPHVMREVTPDDCDPDRVTPTVSGTSLVPDELLAMMYPNG
jgi:hypothetical protein